MAKKDISKGDDASSNPIEIQDIENQLILIWEKNRSLIIGGISAVLAVFIAYTAYGYFKRQAELSLRTGYQEASSDQAKNQWAKEHSDSVLGGFAFKELGDEATKAGDLTAAETHYRAAMQSTVGVMKEATTIALALNLKQQSKDAEAAQLLESLANDPQSKSQAEAQFRLAQIAAEKGDTDSAKDWVAKIDPMNSLWKTRADSLEKNL